MPRDLTVSVGARRLVVTVMPNARATVVPAPPQVAPAGGTVAQRLSVAALARGPAGAPGYCGFDHQQSQPSTVWMIDHNLGRYPTVRTRDSDGREIEGVPSWPTLDRVVVEFSAAIGGSAYLI